RVVNRTAAAESGTGDDQRHMNRALVTAALVLGIPGPEMAAVVADEHHDRALGQLALCQLPPQPPDVLIDARDAAIVVGELLLPVARKEREVGRHERIAIAIGVAVWRDETVAVVLKVRLEVRDDEEERLARAVEKPHDPIGDEIDAILIGEADLVAVAVPDAALVGMRRALQRIRAFPETVEPAA